MASPYKAARCCVPVILTGVGFTFPSPTRTQRPRPTHPPRVVGRAGPRTHRGGLYPAAGLCARPAGPVDQQVTALALQTWEHVTPLLRLDDASCGEKRAVSRCSPGAQADTGDSRRGGQHPASSGAAPQVQLCTGPSVSGQGVLRTVSSPTESPRSRGCIPKRVRTVTLPRGPSEDNRLVVELGPHGPTVDWLHVCKRGTDTGRGRCSDGVWAGRSDAHPGRRQVSSRLSRQHAAHCQTRHPPQLWEDAQNPGFSRRRGVRSCEDRRVSVHVPGARRVDHPLGGSGKRQAGWGESPPGHGVSLGAVPPQAVPRTGLCPPESHGEALMQCGGPRDGAFTEVTQLKRCHQGGSRSHRISALMGGAFRAPFLPWRRVQGRGQTARGGRPKAPAPRAEKPSVGC